MSTRPDNMEYLDTRLKARRSATLVQLAALAGAGLCIALAARLQGPINQQRKDLQLVMQSNIYRELPPEYAWVTATGGTFRGIAADFLWMRLENLKQEGSYYEAHQLAKWICTLQPRFPAVWSFQAWNMSYNISVATHTPRERWQWVYNGIRLLRDEGIPNNERVTPLYHQLAWTWFHKVGDRSDDFHWTYKRIWAATMETLLGAPPTGVSSAEAIDWFRPVANAPQRLDQLIARRPGVEKLVDQLSALGIDVQVSTNNQLIFHPLEETLFKSYTAWILKKQQAIAESTEAGESSDNTSAAKDMQSRRFTFFAAAPREDFDALLAWARAKVLREQYKMDPQYMLDLTGEIGSEEPIPIDWRTPWSQSMYWAKYGVDKAKELTHPKEFDIINTDRIMLFSIRFLSKFGRVMFRINQDDPGNSFLIMGPDFRYIAAMHHKYIEMGKIHADEGEDVGETAGETLRSGHVNFLQAAIVDLYLWGQRDEARKYLDYLATHYKDMYSRETNPRYLQGLDGFVYSEIKEQVESYTEVTSALVSVLTNAYISLGSGYYDNYLESVQIAAQIYRQYQKEHGDTRQGRLTLHEFADIRALALGQFITNPTFPMVYRTLAWRSEQDEIKKRCYDFVLPELRRLASEEGLDVAKAFPAPSGMAEWRLAHPTPTTPEQVAEEQLKKKREAEKQ